MTDETAVGAASDDTLLIAPHADAVTHLQAWSQETVPDDLVPYPSTGTVVTPVTLSRDRHWSWPLTIVIAVGFVVAPALVVAGVEPTPTVSTSESPTTHEPLSCPVGTKPGAAGNCDVAEPLPPVTVVPPPVTITAAPPTVTQTIDPAPGPVIPPTAHAKPAFAPTPAEDQAVLDHLTSLGKVTDPALVISEAHESCQLTQQGERARQVDETLMAEHGMDRTVASLISSTATLEYANCY